MKNILNYSQPEFYHFSEDSIQLVSFAIDLLKGRNELARGIDFGAGSGVIGIEAKLKIPSIKKMTLLELQPEFLPFIKENLEKSDLKSINILNQSIGEYKGEVDVIFSNPPYFLPGKGRVSTQKNKQVCRTFEIDGWNIFFEKVKEVLSPRGLLFFCIKDPAIVKSFMKEFKIVKEEKTNGATLFCLSRLNIDRS